MNAPDRFLGTAARPLAHSTLFAGLLPAQLAEVGSIAQRRTLAAGEYVFHVGDAAGELFVVNAGAVEIVQEDEGSRTRHGLIRLGEGAGFGEGSLVDGAVRPLSVRVLEDCELLCVPYDALRALMEADPALARRLQGNFAEQAVWNFRALGRVAVQSLQEKLAIAQAHERSEVFIITMLVVLCAYVFILQIGAQFLHGRFSTSWLSIPGFVVFFLLFYRAVRRSGEPVANYGVTLRGWQRSLRESLLFSLPIFALCLAAKWLLVTLHPAMAGEPLLVFPSNLTATTLLEAAAYVLFSPFQEFIVRGAMQGSLESFLTGPRRVFKAILIANLMYAMLHLYMSVLFSLMVFVPGLVWGWMAARHRTLVGATVSHALCGIFGFFVVGFDHLILIYG